MFGVRGGVGHIKAGPTLLEFKAQNKCSLNDIWNLKPGYLGPWTLRASKKKTVVQPNDIREMFFKGLGSAVRGR